MIRIAKPNSSAAYRRKATAETQKSCQLYDADPAKFSKVGMAANAKVYNARGVKKSLKNAQSNKCCFCEKPQVDEWGAVEHYRPKEAVRQGKSKRRKYPGYYWLAYEWDNLFFICAVCNTEYKNDIFPLAHDCDRANNHQASVAVENPLLVHPENDNPRDHIGFIGENVVHKTTKGKVTISTCGLDRGELEQLRREHLVQNIKLMIDIYNITTAKFDGSPEFQKMLDCSSRRLRESILPTSPYSSMAIDYLEAQGLLAIFSQP